MTTHHFVICKDLEVRKLTTLWGMQTCIGGLPGNKTTCSVRVQNWRKEKTLITKVWKGLTMDKNTFSVYFVNLDWNFTSLPGLDTLRSLGKFVHCAATLPARICRLLLTFSWIILIFVIALSVDEFLVNLGDPSTILGQSLWHCVQIFVV